LFSRGDFEMRPFVALVLASLPLACFTGEATKHLYCRSDASCGEGQTCIVPPGEQWGQCDGPAPTTGETETDTATTEPDADTGDPTTGPPTREPS
jgi:hypothetical protein